MDNRIKSFEIWQESVHSCLRNDPLWTFLVYPKASFAHDLAWEDCEYLLKDRRGKEVAAQLIRSVGSISANIKEGYGRGYGKDYSYRLWIDIWAKPASHAVGTGVGANCCLLRSSTTE